MRTPDVAIVSPFPRLGERHDGWTGVASYSANLAGALGDAGARVTVLASIDERSPSVARVGDVEVRRVWRRGPLALPAAAAAARATGAAVVHLQHELFLYGGPAAMPALAPALAGLRGRRTVVTMHHVIDPAAVDATFTATHRVRAPTRLVRAGVVAVQRTIPALADAVVVHEPAFTALIPSAELVPHGIEVVPPHESGARRRPIEVPPHADRAAARAALGMRDGRLCVLCFGFLAPYKGLEAALGAARLAGDGVQLVVAGGVHPRVGADYERALRASAPANARFTGFVPGADVGRWFTAADLVLLPYPQPFASSGPLALALAHRTPVLLSPALARTTGAPDTLAVGLDPAAIAGRLRALAADASELAALRTATAALATGRTWPEVARLHLDLYGRFR